MYPRGYGYAKRTEHVGHVAQVARGMYTDILYLVRSTAS